MELEFQPVIIIGAGRSGTNMLRDSLCKLPDFATWECDEINPIWRHGNTNMPHDLFTEQQATPAVSSYLRKQFIKQWKAQNKPDYLVEKTCANSLRVRFIAHVFPEAKFVYIVRQGSDVVSSASKRWKGEMEIPSLPYYISKLRHTPIADIPRYGWRFLAGRAEKIIGQKEHMSFWGPQFPLLNELPEDTPLDELCAHQWASCVDESDQAFSKMNPEQWKLIRYEDFVIDPALHMADILSFLNSKHCESSIKDTVSNISSKSVGKGSKTGNNLSENVTNILAPILQKHNYRD